MLGTSRVVATLAILFACACGTGDTKVDPGDLELRDLLGVAPEVATSWDVEQRTAARRILVANLDELEGEQIRVELAPAQSPDNQIARTLATLDAERFAAGDGALGFVRVELTTTELTAQRASAPTVVAVADGNMPVPAISIELSDRWGSIPPRGRDVLTALAVDAGYESGTLVVTPVPRLAVIASYAAGNPARLTVNPVLIAALDPSATEPLVMTTAPRTTGPSAPSAPKPPTAVAAGNPYSFYGSIAECAYAQRLRCESCLPSSNCASTLEDTDGNTECNKLAESDGRGYFLYCINHALAITSVDNCAADAVSGCTRDTTAANDLSRLEANANFLDDATCTAGLDGCLSDIYGSSDNPFPSIVDGGVSPPPPDPPRNTDVSCGDSCDDDKSSNCEASPNCNCEGPSCNNSFSCDSTCASSNDQSGCGSCDSCESDSDGGGGGGGGGCSSDSSSGGGGGGCSSDDSSSGGGGGCSSDSSSGGGSCGSCDSSSSSGGGSCGSCDSSSGGGGGGGGGGCSGGGSSGGDSCGGSSGGDSCGGGGGGGCSGGGGGGGSCQVTRKPPSAGFAVALSLTWALLPIPLAAVIKRRARKKKKRAAAGNAKPDEEVAS